MDGHVRSCGQGLNGHGLPEYDIGQTAGAGPPDRAWLPGHQPIRAPVPRVQASARWWAKAESTNILFGVNAARSRTATRYDAIVQVTFLTGITSSARRRRVCCLSDAVIADPSERHPEHSSASAPHSPCMLPQHSQGGEARLDRDSRFLGGGSRTATSAFIDGRPKGDTGRNDFRVRISPASSPKKERRGRLGSRPLLASDAIAVGVQV